MFRQLVKTILAALVSDCRTYWDNYFEAAIIMGVAFLLFYCGILLLKSAYQKRIPRYEIIYSCMKLPVVATLGFYCYMVLGITIFSRNEEAAYIINWIPFSTWGTSCWHLTLWVENILMMVPLGILLYIVWKPFRKFGWSLLAGFIFSLSIECMQLYTRRGKFETDDIMNNVVGMLIGFLLCKGISGIFSRC